MRVGIDLGGTKIEGAVLAGGRVLWRTRVPTPSVYGDVLRALAALVAELEDGERLPVGIGTPGASLDGRMCHAENTALQGQRFVSDASSALGRQVVVANDAHCFALSEALDGAGAGASVVFGVIVGTGTGGGVVVDGRLLRGPTGVAGEWGHSPLPGASGSELPGRQCGCGRRGCIETWLAGPGLAADHEVVTGQRWSGARIASEARAGDPGATATLERWADRMARGLATVVHLLDPDVIVLGGGVSKIEEVYPMIRRRLPSHVCAGGPVRNRIVPARFGDASGVRGAARLTG